MIAPPSPEALRTARAHLSGAARALQFMADKREQDMDFRQYESPVDAARALRERAAEIERVVQWLDRLAP